MNSAKLNATGAINATKNAIGAALGSSSSSIMVFLVITVVVIVCIIGYIVYKVRRADLQSVDLVKNPRKLFGSGGSPLVIDGNKMPATLNGQEFAFSFWMYLLDSSPTADHKVVFYRGGSSSLTTTSVIGSSPVVSMDKSSNRLRVSVRTGNAVTPASSTASYSITNILADPGYLTASIDYLPLQRWVHVVAVVQDNLLTLYEDGDIYTVENVSDLQGSPVFSGISGQLTVGGGANEVRGYVNKLQYYNYALSPRDVRQLYENGPTSNSVLNLLGVDNYGMRTPIYKTDGSG